METCNSDPKVAILSAKTTDEVLGHIDTGNSDANHIVLQAQNDR